MPLNPSDLPAFEALLTALQTYNPALYAELSQLYDDPDADVSRKAQWVWFRVLLQPTS
jgi:hypothetical protein